MKFDKQLIKITFLLKNLKFDYAQLAVILEKIEKRFLIIKICKMDNKV